MNGEKFYSYLVEQLKTGDELHLGKNGTRYLFEGWYKGSLQFSGTQTKSIPREVLIKMCVAIKTGEKINANWLRENDLESFASRVALIKSIIDKFYMAQGEHCKSVA